MVIFGNSLTEQLPVASGTQILVTYTLFFGHVKGLPNKQITKVQVGPPAPQFQQTVITQLAQEMEEESIGILLSDKYLENNKIASLEMLQGTDRLLWKTIQQLGGCCRIQTVLLDAYFDPDGKILKPKKRPSAVYAFDEAIQNVMNGIKPQQQQQLILFYCLSQMTPDFTYTEYSEDDDSENEFAKSTAWRESYEQKKYLLPALIVKFPTHWSRVRLLWIARKKNNPGECPIATLPNDIIKVFGRMIQKEAVENVKKRKREEEEEENDSRSDSEDSDSD